MAADNWRTEALSNRGPAETGANRTSSGFISANKQRSIPSLEWQIERMP